MGQILSFLRKWFYPKSKKGEEIVTDHLGIYQAIFPEDKDHHCIDIPDYVQPIWCSSSTGTAIFENHDTNLDLTTPLIVEEAAKRKRKKKNKENQVSDHGHYDNAITKVLVKKVTNNNNEKQAIDHSHDKEEDKKNVLDHGHDKVIITQVPEKRGTIYKEKKKKNGKQVIDGGGDKEEVTKKIKGKQILDNDQEKVVITEVLEKKVTRKRRKNKAKQVLDHVPDTEKDVTKKNMGIKVVDHGHDKEQLTKVKMKNMGIQVEDHKVKTKNMGIQVEDHKVKTKNKGIQVVDHKVKTKNVGIQVVDHKVKTKNRGIQVVEHKVKTKNRGIQVVDHKVKMKNRGIQVVDHKVKMKNMGIQVVDNGHEKEEVTKKKTKKKKKGEQVLVQGHDKVSIKEVLEKVTTAINHVHVPSVSRYIALKKIGLYNSCQRILLVGEGDFSFSASLAVAFGTSAVNITATSLNSQEFLTQNYGKFLNNKAELEKHGSVVLHKVDATNMVQHPLLSIMLLFDRIIFNFPHAGKFGHSDSELRKHQDLVRGFLTNAKKMIKEDGEIHITSKSNGFYLNWDIPKIGSDQGLQLIQEVEFERRNYPGYNTKYGFGGDKNFDCNPSKTYMFRLSQNSTMLVY